MSCESTEKRLKLTIRANDDGSVIISIKPFDSKSFKIDVSDAEGAYLQGQEGIWYVDEILEKLTVLIKDTGVICVTVIGMYDDEVACDVHDKHIDTDKFLGILKSWIGSSDNDLGDLEDRLVAA